MSTTSEAELRGAGDPAKLEVKDGIAWIRLDDPGKRVNTLSTRLFAWFQQTLPEVEAAAPKGLVVISDKADHFMAGADIEELEALDNEDQVYALLEQAHAFISGLAELPFPTVAAVHGACLGGGLELALACTAIVASDHTKTRLGLPEVQLGLFPGMGGTQRLPRRIGVVDGLELILTGRQIDAERALDLGLVDEVCPPELLAERAVSLVPRAAGGLPHGPVGTQRQLLHLAARTPRLNRLVFGPAEQRVRRQTGGHYPAPLAALRVVEQGLRQPLPAALELEAREFSKLVVSDQARKLMAIFFMKNDVEARAAKLAATAPPLTTIGILGAGFMGSGIAQVLAQRGIKALMKDRDRPSLERGLRFCAERFEELEARGRLSPEEAAAARARVNGTTNYADLAAAQLVIEAVFEDLEVKHRVVRELEAGVPESTLFASNTSAIPITEIARASRRPEQVVGLHFFSPVHRMPLVEVIRTDRTNETTLATAVAVALAMGKTPIVVADGPGFFTSRVLAPFLNEAAWCLRDGATIEQIDRALTAWGWPVGAMALLDEVGLDVAEHVAGVLVESLGTRLEPPEAFAHLIADGRLGRKSGRGFYRYGEGRKRVDEEVYRLLDWQPKRLEDRDIADRCWLQMLAEVVRTMQEGIISEPDDIDLGVIFGFGFPPFRGGILCHADELGIDTVVARLEELARLHGPRFEPPERLRSMARDGVQFRPREVPSGQAERVG